MPELAVTGAYVLTALAALVYFIDHIARSVRIDSLMREVNEDTQKVIRHLASAGRSEDVAVVMPEVPPGAGIVPAPRSGFVQSVDERPLLQVAEAHGVVIRLEPTIGDRDIVGMPPAWWWSDRGGDASPAAEAVASAVEDATPTG